MADEHAQPMPPNAVGSIVMALGIFCVGALQRLPYGETATKPAAELVTALWFVLALALIVSIWKRGIGRRTRSALRSFSAGTWRAYAVLFALLAQVAVMAMAFPARTRAS